MKNYDQRNIRLLAAIIVAAVGILLLLPKQKAPVAREQSRGAGFQEENPHTFATMRSSAHKSADDIAEQEWLHSMRDAMSGDDRCAAFAHVLKNSSTAYKAVDWAKTIDDESSRNMALDSIACAWGKCDAKAAVQWALGFTDDALTKSALLTTVFTSWAAQDPTAASKYLMTLEPANQSDAIAVVAPALAAKNPKEAMQWGQSLNAEDARNVARHYVVNAWAANSPADAADWALAQPDAVNRADDVKTIVQKWLESDARAAMEWVQHLPQGTSRDGALDLIASQFPDWDKSLAAKAWIQNAPVSDSKGTPVAAPQ